MTRFIHHIALGLLVGLGLLGCATTSQPGAITPAVWVDQHQGVIRASVQGAIAVALTAKPEMREPLQLWVQRVQASSDKPTTLQAVKALFLSTLPELKLPPDKEELLRQIVPIVVNAVEIALQEAKVQLNDQDILPITRQLVGWVAITL